MFLQSKKISDVAELNNAKHLSESLKHWIGDYRNFYTKLSGDLNRTVNLKRSKFESIDNKYSYNGDQL